MCAVTTLALSAGAVETASSGRPSADSGSVASFSSAQQVSKRVRAYLYARSDGERAKHEWVLFLVEKDEIPPVDEKEGSLDVDEAEITAVETRNRIYLWAYDFASGFVWLNHHNDDAPPGDGAARNKYSMANGRVFCLSDSGTVAQVRVERALLDEVFARQPQRRTNIVPGKPWIRVSLNDEGAFYRELFATLRKQHLSIDRFLQRPEGLSREQDPDVRLYGQKIPFQAQGNTNELPRNVVAGTNDAATSMFPRPTPLPRPAQVERLYP
jgi:hypothetical protein